MSKLIIVIQEKGGLGKTFLAIHVVSYLRRFKGVNFRPVDFDAQAGLISKIYPAPDSANVSPDLELLLQGESILPELMKRVLDGDNFLVDCGANTGRAWSVLFKKVWPSLLQDLDAKGVKIVLLVPVTSDEKSRAFFDHYKGIFPGATQIMCVLRQFDDQTFALPSHDPDLIINIPRAAPKLFSTYESEHMTIDAIMESTKPELARIRGFASGYLPELHKEFDKIKTHLLP